MTINYTRKSIQPDNSRQTGRAGVANGSLVLTPSGYKPIEVLAAGDEITDAFGTRQTIVGVRLNSFNLLDNPKKGLYPVEFQAGSIGPDCPSFSVRLAPGQSILVHGLSFDGFDLEGDFLAPAGVFTNISDIRVIDVTRITYFQLVFEKRVCFVVNGVGVEGAIAPDSALSLQREADSFDAEDGQDTGEQKSVMEQVPRLTVRDGAVHAGLAFVGHSGRPLRPGLGMPGAHR